MADDTRRNDEAKRSAKQSELMKARSAKRQPDLMKARSGKRQPEVMDADRKSSKRTSG